MLMLMLPHPAPQMSCVCGEAKPGEQVITCSGCGRQMHARCTCADARPAGQPWLCPLCDLQASAGLSVRRRCCCTPALLQLLLGSCCCGRRPS
jgi:hypothetical protein